MNADLLERLIAAGTPMALVAEVAAEFARAEAAAKPSAGALRTRRWRDAQRHQVSPSVTGDAEVTAVTGCDDGDAQPPAPNKNPQTPKINPTPHTGEAPASAPTCEGPIPGHRLPLLVVLVAAAYHGSLVASRDATEAKPPRRAATLPDGFEPALTAEAARIVAAWPCGMFERELAQWRDYHATRGTLAKDWQASLRTWIRNAEKFRTERNERPNRPAFHERPSGWAPRPGMAGAEPASLDD